MLVSLSSQGPKHLRKEATEHSQPFFGICEQPDQAVEGLVDRLVPGLEVRSERPELAFQIARADSEDEAAVGHEVHARGALREQQGAPVGQDRQVRQQSEPIRRHRGARQQAQEAGGEVDYGDIPF